MLHFSSNLKNTHWKNIWTLNSYTIIIFSINYVSDQRDKPPSLMEDGTETDTRMNIDIEAGESA